MLVALSATTVPAAELPRVAVPAYGASLSVRLGLKDKEPTNSDGSISLSHGRLVKVTVPKPRTGTAADGVWKLESVPFQQKGPRSVHDPKAPKLVTPDLIVTLDGARRWRRRSRSPRRKATSRSSWPT